MNFMIKRHLAAHIILCNLLVPTAFAVDGVLEINHACATQTGCFSGDSAGYPITIDGIAGGSYLLTSNLIVPDEDTNGIQVNTSSISIDLNGFEIVRAGCEGATKDCTPKSGFGAGVRISPERLGVSVKNGSITGMGWAGVYLAGEQSEATGIRARWNRLYGIFTGPGAIVSGNSAFGNLGIGIRVGEGSTVSGNTAYKNGDDGIQALSGSTVSGNTAYINVAAGIQTGTGCLVQRNTVRNNTGYGLNLPADAAYRENVITGNTAGTVNGGFSMGDNFCDTDATCP